ncbi:MAG: PepSY domain-containing protein, partial [Bacteroidetes bacterium]|nr:PepSY domain-containing protein [Bacteroidota bacterium]
MNRGLQLSLLAAFCVLFISTSSYAGYNPDITFIKNTKALPDLKKQRALQNTIAWQNFKQQHGNWYVEFNEVSGMPRRAFGKPISMPAGDMSILADNFITNQLNMFEIPVDELIITRIQENKKKYYIDYKQVHQGLEVLYARLTLRVGLNGSVFMFGVDVFNDININLIPSITEDQAIEFAENAIVTQLGVSYVNNVLKILPVPGKEAYDYRLVYEVTVNTTDDENMPGKYYTLVDAHNGEILYRDNQIRTVVNLHLEGDLYTKHPYFPSSVEGLGHARVIVNGTTYYTDANGDLTLNDNGSVSAVIRLWGRYSRVVTGNNGSISPVMSRTLTQGNNTETFDNNATIQQISAYQSVNIIHDYMKAYWPTFTALDWDLTTRVDRTDGSCNAFFGGQGINFYLTGNGCNGYSLLRDVVHHEYGHAINSYFYNWQGAGFSSGSLGEGYSDIWGCGISENPVLGLGRSMTNPASFIRRYDINPKVYPQDIVGQVHRDGEIIAGAWWDAGQNMGDIQGMMTVFADHYFGLPNGPTGAEGQVYRDALYEALVADDNDNDLSNGTPNGVHIACAFADHGLSLLPDFEQAHSEPVIYNPLDSIILTVDMASSLPWYMDSMMLHYRTKYSDPWTTVGMVQNGTDFEGIIPPQLPGNLIHYYFEQTNVCGGTGVFPEFVDLTVGNIPYVTMVGYKLVEMQDFDDNMRVWSTFDVSD